MVYSIDPDFFRSANEIRLRCHIQNHSEIHILKCPEKKKKKNSFFCSGATGAAPDLSIIMKWCESCTHHLQDSREPLTQPWCNAVPSILHRLWQAALSALRPLKAGWRRLSQSAQSNLYESGRRSRPGFISSKKKTQNTTDKTLLDNHISTCWQTRKNK